MDSYDVFVSCYYTGGSNQSYFSHYFLPSNTLCRGLAICLSHLAVDTCSFQFGMDPSYSNFNKQITGPLNVPFELPLLEPSMTYYYQVSIAVDDSFSISLRDTHRTGECDGSSASQVAIIVMFPI